eukprot:779795-Pyramimonas_sp.AAC.1
MARFSRRRGRGLSGWPPRAPSPAVDFEAAIHGDWRGRAWARRSTFHIGSEVGKGGRGEVGLGCEGLKGYNSFPRLRVPATSSDGVVAVVLVALL